jgi:hypothetical protein
MKKTPKLAATPKVLKINPRDQRALAIMALTHVMRVGTKAVAEAMLDGEEIKYRNVPNVPFVVEELELHVGFSKFNWIARGKDAPRESIEVHNLVTRITKPSDE